MFAWAEWKEPESSDDRCCL